MRGREAGRDGFALDGVLREGAGPAGALFPEDLRSALVFRFAIGAHL
jgi:hypothetical protein